jgi:hypothetical protein
MFRKALTCKHLSKACQEQHSTYLGKLLIYSRKEFYNIGPCGMYYKNFMIVIYNHNDSTIVIYGLNDSRQFYETITIALA